MASELEKSTFKTLDTVRNLYESAQDDEQKLYHLRNMTSIIKSLQAFVESKLELSRPAKGAKSVDVNVNVTGAGDINTKKE